MISLNLLPPEKKRSVSRQIIFFSLQNLISWSLITICIAGIFLLLTEFFMQISFNEAVREGALVTQEYGALNQKVFLANQKIDFIADLQKNFITWSPKLAALSALTPNSIILNSINADRGTNEIQIAGKAATREDLLLYKQNLEQSSLITSINFPIENILEAKNINFSIKGKISL